MNVLIWCTFAQSGMAVAFVELMDQFPPFSASITSPPRIAPLQGVPELQ